MSIIRAKVTIVTDGIINKNVYKAIMKEKENIIIYDDESNVTNIVDIENNVITRKNKEYVLKLDFSDKSNSRASLEFFGSNKVLDIDILAKDIKNNNGTFYVKYIIDNADIFEYYLEVEKLEKK